MIYELLKFIYVIIVEKMLFMFKSAKWRMMNKHNKTTIGRNFILTNIKVGNGSYGNLKVYNYGTLGEGLNIGNYVSIADNVLFILGGNHQIYALSSFPFATFLNKGDRQLDAQTKGPIVVENEVWIGNNVIVLSGITIGKGAIIAAGSVVTKNIPPYTIVGGNPAKVIKERFSKEIKESLLEFDLSTYSNEQIAENIDLLYLPLTSNFEIIKERFNSNGGKHNNS